MTLKEIEKIIDEADFFWAKNGDEKRVVSLTYEWCKVFEKSCIERDIKNGYTFTFFKLNDNGDVEKRWVVDHIDKEKKIIKKS